MKGIQPMPAKSKVESVEAPIAADEVDYQLLTTAPDDWDFETVTDESPTRVKFTTFGDTVILQYVRKDHIEQEPDRDGKDQSFDLLIWNGRDGKPYSLNPTYKLTQAMEIVQPGDWCRLTYVKDVETKRGLQPMQDIKVERKSN